MNNNINSKLKAVLGILTTILFATAIFMYILESYYYMSNSEICKDGIELLEKKLHKKNSIINSLEYELFNLERSSKEIVIDSLNEVIDSLNYGLDIEKEQRLEYSMKTVNLTKDVDNYRVLVDKLSDEINNLEKRILRDSLEANLKISKINQGMSTRYSYDSLVRHTGTVYFGNNILIDSFLYDEVGAIVRHLRWTEDSVSYFYDSSSKIIQNVEPKGQVTRFIYPKKTILYEKQQLNLIKEENQKLKVIIISIMITVLLTVFFYFVFLFRRNKI